VYPANLDPTVGREIAKTRPVVIVSLEAMNQFAGTVVVCPLTTVLHPTWRSRLAVRCAGKAAELAVEQIRTISTLRLVKKVGSLGPDHAARLRELIVEMYGLP